MMTISNLKLHLGCGSNILTGWNNIDLDSPQADQHLDLTQPLPFQDATVSHIFTEHFIEHITRAQAVEFLKECYRLLAQDGVIRITTPNLRFLVFTYFSDKVNEWGDLWQPASRCLMLNEGMRAWGHHFLYDAEELTRVLGEAGFKSVSFQDYRASEDEVLVGLETRPFHNELIVEARKSTALDFNLEIKILNANEASWSSQNNTPSLIAEQTKVRLAMESKARADFIEVQSATIHQLETRIHELEASIHKQEVLISHTQAKLVAFQSSLFGKIYSFFNRNV
ncbi:methyltransferase domain-containing protein [Variovorax sp. PCZ-1]|uniref:class I SAM-dependent methyltransferase n=1 Tax=Variovorax sp. PCZ-1 TaxID=2835533 RepID=UPI001BCA845A|nr:methyltransferase domain-containing protein [Variovorax sp. PCZ-1]MBS7808222.1 methyltransferase domain-containing protein [Variovorax sp. PCZ-1]